MRIANLFLTGAFLLAASTAWAGSVTWKIGVDTTPISGAYGYLDFVFDPGPNDAAPATASLAGFQSDGTLDLTALLTDGDVSGDLPATVTFDNGAQLNDYSPGFTYGTFIDFQVTIAWTQPGTPPDSGSTFAFYLYDSSVNPVLSSGPGGEAFDLNVNPDGTTSVVNHSPQSSISPEPASLLFALPVFGLLRRRN